MSTVLTPEQVAAGAAPHIRTLSQNAMTRGMPICRDCLTSWPCVFARIAASHAALAGECRDWGRLAEQDKMVLDIVRQERDAALAEVARLRAVLQRILGLGGEHG